MADGETERITILLQAQAAEFDRTMKRTQREFARAMRSLDKDSSVATRKLEANLKSAGASALSFGKTFAVGLGVGAATAIFAGVSGNIRQVVGDLADLKDQADRVGMSAEDFQALQHGMKLAGVEAGEFGKSMEKFTENIGDAARGTGSLRTVLSANGIAIRDMAGEVRPTADLLRGFADLIRRTPDEATRMSLVTDAFGRSGKAMVLAMQDGGRGLDLMMAKAVEAGAVLDEETIAKAAELDDRFDALTARVGTFFQTIIVGAADAGVAMADMVASLGDAKAHEAMRQVEYDLESIAGAADEAVAAMNDDAWNLMQMDGDDFNAAGVEVANLAAEIEALTQQFRNGELGLEEYTGEMETVRDRTTLLLSSLDSLNDIDMSGAIAAVAAIGATLDAVAAKARAMAASSLQTNFAPLSGPAGGHITTSPLAPSTSPRPKTGGFVEVDIPGTGAGTGAGTGGGQNEQLREAERLYEATRTDAEKYAAELIEINDLLADGYITQDTYNRALDAAKEKYAETTDAANFFQDVNTDLKNAFLDMAVDGVDSFDAIARAIKRAALEAALFGSGPMGGMLGGGLFGMVGGLFGKRANGGAVAAGQGYLVGENGPEHFYPGRSGAIVPHAKSGGGAVQVQVAGGDLVLTDSGQIAARIKVTAQQAAGAAVHTVKQNLPGWQRQYQTDGVIA